MVLCEDPGSSFLVMGEVGTDGHAKMQRARSEMKQKGSWESGY